LTKKKKKKKKDALESARIACESIPTVRLGIVVSPRAALAVIAIGWIQSRIPAVFLFFDKMRVSGHELLCDTSSVIIVAS
jgi:hypothetical protein